MQLLQDQARLPLIVRSAAGTVATDAGAEILRTIDQIETLLEDCNAALAAIAGSQRGSVTVGVVSTAKYFAPRVLGDFVRVHPGLELRREPGSGTRALMEKFFADAGIAPRIGMQISSNETIKQAVIAGLGIAFLSGHTIDSSLVTHSLSILPVEGLPIIRQWCIVHLRQRRLMPAVQAIRDFFIAESARYVPDIKM
jgi:DNA-binding transcriptional LysR family regulator